MEFSTSQVREIDSVSIEQETCKKFDELRNLQTLLRLLKEKLRGKDKNYVKYRRFYENIVKIIKNKLNYDSITTEEKSFEEIDYRLIDQNNIIINGEQLILSDKNHQDFSLNKTNKSYVDKTITKEDFTISSDYLHKEEIFVLNNQKVVRLDEDEFIPLKYYRKLYSHQKKGLSWLVKLHKNNMGGILADDMGLGKTITILSLINTLIYSSVNLKYFNKLTNLNSNIYNNPDNNKDEKEIGIVETYRIMIVCNVTLIEQWKNEINKWILGNIKLYILHSNYDFEHNYFENKSNDKRNNFDVDNNVEYIIYLIGYEYLRINIEYINNYEWYYLILDEGQKIRNPNSLITLAVKTIKTPHRIIISGSPIQNNLIELWSLIDFILPNYLGSLSSFIEDFVVPITSGGSGSERLNNRHINKLRMLIIPYIFRTLKPNNPDNNNEQKDSKLNSENESSLRGNKQDNEDLFNTIIGIGDDEDEEDHMEYKKKEDDENQNREDEKSFKEEVELPNKIERIILCNLTMEQYKLYVSALNKYRYRDRYKNKSILSKETRRVIGKELRRDKNILKLINILRKICNHPKLLTYTAFPNNHLYNDNTEMPLEDEVELYNEWIKQKNIDQKEDEDEYSGYKENDIYNKKDSKNSLYRIKYKDNKNKSSSKLNVSMNIIDIWRNQGNKILLFTQTISMSMIIYDELIKKYKKEEMVILNGKISINNRNKIIERFTKDNRIFIMLLTTKVGGVGLNLTIATRIIIYDPDWNPMTDLQARERSYRIGQNKDIIIYRLITANTIEEKIYQRQLYKCYLTQKILNNYQLTFFNKYINNLQYLLSYPPPPYSNTNKDNMGKEYNNEWINKNIDQKEDEDEYSGKGNKWALINEDDGANKYKEDETYKILIENDANRNINSFIKYNDIESYNNSTNGSNFNYSSFFVMKEEKFNANSDLYNKEKEEFMKRNINYNINKQIDKSRELLYNLKSKGNKNIKYIITNKILGYFNQNKHKEISTNDLINYFKPIIPDEYHKLFKRILKDLCDLIKDKESSSWKLRSKYHNVLPN